MAERADIKPLFGEIGNDADNLEIVGPLANRVRLIPNAEIWGSSGLVLDESKSPLIEPIWVENHLRYCPDPKGWRRWIPRRMAGRWYSTMLFWGNGYYHWICDVLPRLHRDLPSLDAETRIIVSSNLRDWQWRSLELLGVPRDRCVEFTGARPWRVEWLHHSTPLAMTGDHDAQGLLAMRQELLNRLGLNPEGVPGPRRLYVSRGQRSERAIVNEAELLPALADWGLEVIRSEELTFDEQVRLFSEAGMVVGPHGGGLTNLLWCGKGSRLLEFFGTDSIRRCYWTLSRAVGMQHFCGVCPVEGDDSLLTGKLVMDSAHFRKGLGRLFSTPPEAGTEWRASQDQ